MYDQSAAHWRQKVGTLGFLFRALREQRLANNNTYSALSHYVHEKGALTPLNARLHVWCPRRDSKGLRFAKPRASGARRPRHAPLQTGHRPVCLTLRALTRVRHEKGGRNPPRTLTCMYGARGETRTRTLLPTVDFESTASANSATRARNA